MEEKTEIFGEDVEFESSGCIFDVVSGLLKYLEDKGDATGDTTGDAGDTMDWIVTEGEPEKSLEEDLENFKRCFKVKCNSLS